MCTVPYSPLQHIAGSVSNPCQSHAPDICDNVFMDGGSSIGPTAYVNFY